MMGSQRQVGREIALAAGRLAGLAGLAACSLAYSPIASAQAVSASSPVGAVQMRPDAAPAVALGKIDGFTINELMHQALPYISGAISLAFAVLLGRLLWRRWHAAKARGEGLLSGISSAIEETILTNWRLALLGATSLVLSLASGYTTWDGLTHFTCPSPEPNLIICPGAHILSAMATFGIQGVMLIAAWLIGESFASGLRGDGAAGRSSAHAARVDAVARYAILLSLGCMLAYFSGISTSVTERMAANSAWVPLVDKGLLWGGALLLIAAVALAISRPSVLEPYIWAVRTVVSNAMLWLMFFACFTISVFFSFDSLFSTIFPKDQRQRAAEIRAQKEVGEIVNLTGAIAGKRRIEEAEKLFVTPAWEAYEGNLSGLAKAAHGSAGEIEAYFVEQMELRRRGIATQQERIATAQSGKAGLAARKTSLTDELARIKGERPGLAADYNQHKTELDAKSREIDAKRVEAMAEERGVEGTGKVGRGAMYRQRDAELAKLRDEYKIKEERTKDALKRLTAVETRIAQIERELSTLDGDLAKLTGETQTAEQRIKVAQDGAQQEETKIDPSRMLPAFERARGDFRENPTIEGLSQVQQLCGQLVGAMSSTPATRQKVAGIDCDPKAASEAAARVFALNAGLKAFGENCAGGSKLPQDKGTDGLLSFGRKCLQDSALVSQDSAEIGSRLAAVDLNRDDKAHRFVVTWNAFLDHNRLAYLALGIAIALDGLVFLSGLFGANAVRSHNTNAPGAEGQSAQHLDAIIDAALLPDVFDTARAVLHAMRPIAERNGFSSEIQIDPEDPHAADIKRVLNAAATIGSVRDVNVNQSIYEVHGSLSKYLSVVVGRELKADKQHKQRLLEARQVRDLRQQSEERRRELLEVLNVALSPRTSAGDGVMEKIADNVETVLHHMHPINATEPGFTSEILLSEVEREDRSALRTLKSVLNAGSSLQVVRRPDDDDLTRYEIHGDMYKALAQIRARALAMAGASASANHLEGYAPNLTPQPSVIAGPLGARRQLTDQSPRHSGQDGNALRAEYWQLLLAAIHLKPDEANSIIDDEDVLAKVRTAWARLHSLAKTSRLLADWLDAFEAERNRAVTVEFQRLEAESHGQPQRREALMEVTQYLNEYLKDLLLHPNVHLIQQLVYHIEDAAKSDDGLRAGEQALKDRLKEIEARLQAAGRSAAEDEGSDGAKAQQAAIFYNFGRQKRRV